MTEDTYQGHVGRLGGRSLGTREMERLGVHEGLSLRLPDSVAGTLSMNWRVAEGVF